MPNIIKDLVGAIVDTRVASSLVIANHLPDGRVTLDEAPEYSNVALVLKDGRGDTVGLAVPPTPGKFFKPF